MTRRFMISAIGPNHMLAMKGASAASWPGAHGARHVASGVQPRVLSRRLGPWPVIALVIGPVLAPSCDTVYFRSVSPVSLACRTYAVWTALRWLLGVATRGTPRVEGACCRSMLQDSSADAPGKERSCATDGMPSESLNISRSSHRDPDSECDQLCVHNNRISVESRGICLEWAPPQESSGAAILGGSIRPFQVPFAPTGRLSQWHLFSVIHLRVACAGLTAMPELSRLCAAELLTRTRATRTVTLQCAQLAAAVTAGCQFPQAE